ncbi:MAG TPA: hypothetical protein VIF15_15185 [Polyangiaceae bacterium]
MYRDSHDTLAETIERLEQELREVRALRAPRRPRERVLWTVTVLSVAAALFAGAAAGAARARADELALRFEGAALRLELKTRDLGACESLAFNQRNSR